MLHSHSANSNEPSATESDASLSVRDDSHSPLRVYWVRCGTGSDLLQIPTGMLSLSRGDQIVCRTERGVEFAEVLATSSACLSTEVPPAKFLRKATEEDRLLWRELIHLSLVTANACQAYLESLSPCDTLLEVEPLLDGKTLYFHFLGDPSPETESQVQTLAEVYQTTVRESQFSKLLENGCGPGCGTKEKSGCGTSGGCAVCAVASQCQKTSKVKSQ